MDTCEWKQVNKYLGDWITECGASVTVPLSVSLKRCISCGKKISIVAPTYEARTIFGRCPRCNERITIRIVSISNASETREIYCRKCGYSEFRERCTTPVTVE